MTGRAAGPGCPERASETAYGGLVLVAREDGRRACRSLWRCPARLHWWRWTDRPDDPLEPCPLQRCTAPRPHGCIRAPFSTLSTAPRGP